MAMKMQPFMLNTEQWEALRDLAAKENKPSGDVALELIKQALDVQIAAGKPQTKNTDDD